MSKLLHDLKRLRDIWRGFWQSRVIITANNFKIFEHLKKPLSARELSNKLSTDLRATEIILDALVGLDLLKKRGGKYRNASISERFLVEGKPYYQGDMLRYADVMWKNWSELDNSLKTGKPSRIAFDHTSFILAMHNISSFKAKKIINAIDLKGIKTALDLGGGPGTYSLEMAKRGVNVTLFDRPETIEIAKRITNNKKGIDFIGGDFLVNDLGKGYDLIFISQIFHAYSEKDNLLLLRKCKKALNKEGRIVIQEFFINNDRTKPSESAIFSVNMLVNTEAGRCYSPNEMKRWLKNIGLKNIKGRSLDDVLLISGSLL